MQTNNEGLQKLTDENINRVLALKKITHDDLDTLSDSERAQLLSILSKKLNDAKDIERDKYWEKILPVAGEETRNNYWECNHNKMVQEISKFIQTYGRMPTKTEIADATGLSRQTIHKHLKEYASHPQYLGQLEQFKFMNTKLLAKVFEFAIKGDMGAAKLYFNIMGCLGNGQPSNKTLINTQNNYIQINGNVISQETIKKLSPEQLKQVEILLMNTLPDTTKAVNSQHL